MTTTQTDLMIIGAGPVGLMCAYLGYLCGLRSVIIDKSAGPLSVGRADALNARTLQLLEVAKVFDDLYGLGKPCNTSSVWSKGKFISRQSSWWEELEGCFHKHFLMLGQSHVEGLLDARLKDIGMAVKRKTTAENIVLDQKGCLTTLAHGEKVRSHYVIGADGSRSFVRSHFAVPFEIIRPKIVWAVIDGIIDSDFPKVPEIIVFQTETSEVAWIPREGSLDRFYVRMDTKDFSLADAIAKINRSLQPHRLSFKRIDWFSQFSVKESVAENYVIKNRVFLTGDACHIHSVNGGQGLNTGLADAFNLIWKINMVKNFGASTGLLQSYEQERKPIAQSVIETAGELVRSTRDSAKGTHAQDYVKIVEKRAGHITGMGIRYGNHGLSGSRLYDFELFQGEAKTRLYSLLDYARYTLIIFSNESLKIKLPKYIKCLQIYTHKDKLRIWSQKLPFYNQAVLVRPDSYIHSVLSPHKVDSLQEFSLS